MSTKSKKGFTIIEVVLVLAIAGLIFLMVFIALPALQRSQRNTQRADDMSRILTAVNSYQSNNNGKTPFTKGNNNNYTVAPTFVVRYIDETCTLGNDNKYTGCGDQFTDPDGTIYNIAVGGKGGSYTLGSAGRNAIDHIFHVAVNAGCGDEGTTKAGTGERQIAILYQMEGGAVACNDNH